MLDESDIDAIVEHLGNKVQFYDGLGVTDNRVAPDEIRTALESYVGTLSSKSAERFRLVEIAFSKLKFTYPASDAAEERMAIGRAAVELADAVLAAMEQTPDTGPSAEEAVAAVVLRIREQIQELITANQALLANCSSEGKQFREGAGYGLVCALKLVAATEKSAKSRPRPDEVQEEIIEIDEDGVVHAIGERPNLAIVRELRAEIQNRLAADTKVYANNPRTNVRVGGYRHGGSDAYRHVLAMIDAAMEKAGAAEDDDAQ